MTTRSWEPHSDFPPDSLRNPDLDPVPYSDRSWNLWHIASLWVGMSVCIPTYLLAANMVGSGMNWWQSLLAVFLGNAIVLLPLVLNAHAGTRYGIPFPVFARSAFGVRGAHVPSVLRSLVACGWFGIQTWIGGTAINALLEILWPAWGRLGGNWSFMGHGLPEYLGFLLFWLANMYFVWAGTESIKWLETLAAPLLLVVGVGLLWWAADRVGGVTEILRQSEALVDHTGTEGGWSFLLGIFLPWLTAMVGYWATLSLNIADFTRYARSQRDQAFGQALGLLITMPLFAFVGVAVTTVTIHLYGEPVWNPVDLLYRLVSTQRSPWLGIAALLLLSIATLSTNIAANVVAPANSFSNLMPRRISFRAGGILAGILGILIFPWKLLDVYQGWLIGYSGLLGAIGGVLICDYVILRRMQLSLPDLYSNRGRYSYRDGINWSAMLAVAAGIAISLVGRFVPPLAFLFNGAWFFATGVSLFTYYALMKSAS